jgi:hypothetical protein
MLKKIKHGATVMTQSLKKGGGPQFIDPAFGNAFTEFTDYQTRLRTFVDDANAVIAAITPVFKCASDFSALTDKCFETLPSEDQPLSAGLTQLTKDLQLFVNDRVANQATETVVKPLKDVFQQVDELSAIYENHRQSFLILESNKAKLESLQKEPDKKGVEIQSYTEKIATRTSEVERLEAEFITKMSGVWENRFNVLGPPMNSLLEIVADIGRSLMVASEPIITVLGPAALSQDYPSAPEPAPKK